MRISILFFIVVLMSCQGALDLGDESALTQSDPDDPAETQNNTNTSDPITNNPDPMTDPDMGEDDMGEFDLGGNEDMGVVDMRPAPGTVVEFRIPNGSNQGPWNSPDTAVVVYVGQILRVVNDDSIVHQIHAPDDGAIDHGRQLDANGGSQNYDVTAADPLDPSRTNYYDHDIGRSASFWIDARP